jgi:hypothetical protein
MVWVHPRYPETGMINWNRISRNYEQYRGRRNKMLKQSKIPVIILEDYAEIEETNALLDRLKAPAHLIVPTEEGSPALHLRARAPHADPKRGLLEPAIWPGDKHVLPLIHKLESLDGVNTVLIGGCNAHVISNASPDLFAREKYKLVKKIPSLSNYDWRRIVRGQCVGTTYLQFLFKSEKLVPILISGGTYPDNAPYYEYIRQARSAGNKRRGPPPL